MAGRPHGELSSTRNKFVHQVFLSFRGEDVRKGFEGHLFSNLQHEGFRVFRDNEGLEHGRDIQIKLLEAIEQSKVFIVTLSPRYAESRWCLDELAKIMELNNVSPNRFVLPVFFNVEPTDVRHQTGLNREFFEAHEKRFGAEISRVDNWRWALKEVAALKGPSLKDANGNEAQLIQNIIKELRRILATRDLALPPNIIGVDSIVRDICTWIQDGSPDAEVGVIHGQGGIGKTTIAKIVFNANYDDFQGSSFIEDIRKSSEQGNSFLRLQRKLILDISRYEAGDVYNVSEAMTKIRNAIGPKRILLVLDDVEEVEHLGGLLDHPEWFCPGSKIIVTTRNRQIKNIRMFKQEFKICSLNYEESIKLFSLLVFDQNRPLKGYEELSHRFVNYCGGLPLALCVLAPLLRGIKDREIWRDRLHKLEKHPHKRIQVVLKMSFDSLEDEEDRNLFLHVALFFVGRDKEYAFKILKACEVYNKAGFQNLADRCLVSISGGKLMMHHLIQEMGREVVRQESVNEPGLRSRLWDHKETLNVLLKNKGTSSVKGLRLGFPAPKTVTLKEDNLTQHVGNGIGLASIHPPSRRMISNLKSINTVAFTNMDNLNLLLLRYVQLKGGFDNFPKELKWLWWQGCPLESIPQNLELRELVVLDMQHSQLLSVWEDKKKLGALKILKLSHSYCLRSTPDLSNAGDLEWIILEGCISLVKMHDSIGCLRKLTYLNLKGCKNLRRLPKSICQLQSIKRVDLSGCSRLFTELSLSQSQILPSLLSSLNLFTSIVKLSLRNCGVLVSLDAILDSLSCFTSLEDVDLSYNSFEEIKKDFWHFTRLYNKRLQRFKNLRSISQSPSVNIFAPEFLSPEKVEYQQNQYLEDANVSAYNYPESAETEGLLKLEAATKLDVIKDPKLEFFRSSIPLASGGVYYGLRKGVCQYAIYSVILHGDHIREDLFAVKRPGSEISYTVPWRPDHPIRVFNVYCVYQCGRYQKNIRGRLQVENLTRKRTWLYLPEVYPMHPELDQGTEVTWLSDWKVMEVQHRDVRDGDTLKVSFQSGGNIPVKCKMNIFYKVGEEDMVIEMTEVMPDNIVATVNLSEFQ